MFARCSTLTQGMNTLSLGNFSGGEVWICPALETSASAGPAPQDAATQEFPHNPHQMGQAVDTWHQPTTFPCSSLRCTLPWQGDRWVVTAYTCLGLQNFSKAERTSLLALGFPLPMAEMEAQASGESRG